MIGEFLPVIESLLSTKLWVHGSDDEVGEEIVITKLSIKTAAI